MDVIRFRAWAWMLSSKRSSENIANTEGFGTSSKGNTVNTEGFGTCRKREFANAGNDDATDIFGT